MRSFDRYATAGVICYCLDFVVLILKHMSIRNTSRASRSYQERASESRDVNKTSRQELELAGHDEETAISTERTGTVAKKRQLLVTASSHNNSAAA